MSNRKIKSVAFDLEDPFEKKLYEHAMKHKKFAPYILRLIQRDMEGGSSSLTKVEKELPKNINKGDLPI